MASFNLNDLANAEIDLKKLKEESGIILAEGQAGLAMAVSSRLPRIAAPVPQARHAFSECL